MKLVFHIMLMISEDSTVVENTFGGEPKTIVLNNKTKQLIPLIEEKLFNAMIGETIEFTLSPKDAYGSWSKKALQNVPKDQFPKELFEDEELLNQLLSNGLAAQAPNGELIPVKVHSINKDYITVDFNHPFAEKKLKVKLQVLKRE